LGFFGELSNVWRDSKYEIPISLGILVVPVVLGPIGFISLLIILVANNGQLAVQYYMAAGSIDNMACHCVPINKITTIKGLK